MCRSLYLWVQRRFTKRRRCGRQEAGVISTPQEELYDYLLPVQEQIRIAERKYEQARLDLYKKLLELTSCNARLSATPPSFTGVLEQIIAREEELRKGLLARISAIQNEIIAASTEIQGMRSRCYGFIPVRGCDNAGREGDVVFMHGLGGDPVRTWCHGDQQENFWPSWLGDDLPNVGIWTYGYDSKGIRWNRDDLSIDECTVEALGDASVNPKDGQLGAKPIVFVCHSMGGLLVKEMLRRGSNRNVPDAWKAIRTQTRGIVFLATPHYGSDLAKRLCEFAVVLRLTPTVAELAAGNAYLRSLNDWFRETVDPKKIRVECYWDSKPLAGLVPVVDKDSADPRMSGVPVIPVREDHTSICKPTTRNGAIYRQVKRFVRRALKL